MYGVTIALLCLFVLSLLFAALRLKKKGAGTEAGTVAKSLVLYALLTLAALLFRLEVPQVVLWLGMAAVWLSSFVGYYLELYTRSTRFDRLQHGLGAFAFALLLFCLLRALTPAGGSRLFQAVTVFGLGMASGVMCELSEYRTDQKKGTRMQRGLKDTDTDLAADAAGSLLAAALAAALLI